MEENRAVGRLGAGNATIGMRFDGGGDVRWDPCACRLSASRGPTDWQKGRPPICGGSHEKILRAALDARKASVSAVPQTDWTAPSICLFIQWRELRARLRDGVEIAEASAPWVVFRHGRYGLRLAARDLGRCVFTTGHVACAGTNVRPLRDPAPSVS
jgi:hypothetical protein